MEGVEYSVRDSNRVHRVITSRLDGWCFGAVGEKKEKREGGEERKVSRGSENS